MSIFHDPRKDPIVELMPCGIGTGDCEGKADGYCEECGKPTCRGCAVKGKGGLLTCLDCEADLKLAAQKEQQEKKAA